MTFEEIERTLECKTEQWVYRARQTKEGWTVKRVPIERPYFYSTPLVQVYIPRLKEFVPMMSISLRDSWELSSLEEVKAVVE